MSSLSGPGEEEEESMLRSVVSEGFVSSANVVMEEERLDDDQEEEDEETEESDVGLLSSRSTSSSKLLGLGTLFDVDTSDVLLRLKMSLVPMPSKSFFDDCIKNKPDMYGPLWISLTLVLVVAVASNIADYINVVNNQLVDGDNVKFHWHYDFHKVSLATTLVASYVILMPLALHAYLWYASQNNSKSVGLLQLLCLYGYSLAIFVPISLLWLIQLTILQWLLVVLGVGMSGGVLALTLHPLFTRRVQKSAVVLTCVVVLMHALMASGFMIYFFHHQGHTTNVAGASLNNGAEAIVNSTTTNPPNHVEMDGKRSAEFDNPLPLTKSMEQRQNQLPQALQQAKAKPVRQLQEPDNSKAVPTNSNRTAIMSNNDVVESKKSGLQANGNANTTVSQQDRSTRMRVEEEQRVSDEVKKKGQTA